MLVRAAKLGLDLQAHIKTGLVTLRQVDPAQIAPGEFAHIIRKEVEENGARLVVIDSLNGYLSSMPQERQLVLQLHELLAYLNQQGVLTFLVNPQHGVVGSLQTSLDLSYLADTVMLRRFFEAEGRIRKALSIIKNRGGAHEDRIREYRIDGAPANQSNAARRENSSGLHFRHQFFLGRTVAFRAAKNCFRART